MEKKKRRKMLEEDELEEEVSAITASSRGTPMVSPSESRTSNDSLETMCECGRSFRNPHHLYMHKANCKNTEDGTETSGRTTRNSSDRDSGIGISITIKKKNNSYEVVTNKEEMAGKTEAGQHQQQQQQQVFQKTSVLKLQAVEDDEDVDIEDCKK